MKYIIYICIFILHITIALSDTIEGYVLDQDNRGIIGATIRIEGTKQGTYVKSANGYFKIDNLKNQNYTISISSVGKEKVTIENYPLNTPQKIKLKNKTVRTKAVDVFGKKSGSAMQEIPISIASIFQEDIELRPNSDMAATLDIIPGLLVTDDQVGIRGSSGFSFGTGSRVGYMIDGIPMLSADLNDVKFDLIPMQEIETVEVIKGAGSALYGTSALGGIINMKTKTKYTNSLSVSQQIGFYTAPKYETWKISDYPRMESFTKLYFAHSDVVSNLDFSLAGEYKKDDSYRLFDEQRTYTVSPAFQYKYKQGTTKLRIYNAESKNDDWVYWNSLDSATRPPTGTNDDVKLTSRKLGYYLSSNFLVNDLTLKLKNSILNTHFFNSLNEDNKDYRESDATAYYGAAEFHTYIMDDLFISGGASFTLNDVSSFTYGKHDQKIYSIFSQVEYKLPELIVNFGIRADNESIDAFSTDWQISPKLGVSYNLRGFDFRLSAGSGFRAAVIGEKFATANFQGFEVVANPFLQPEKSWSFEFGGKYEEKISDDVFYGFDFSVFDNEMYELIEPTVQSNGKSIIFQNLTRARILGAEAEVRLGYKYFLFTTGVTYLDAKNLDTDEELKYRNKWMSKSSLMTKWNDLAIVLDYKFLTKPDAIDAILGLQVSDHDSYVNMHVVDLSLNYDLDSIFAPVTLKLAAKNLLDYYYTEMVGNLAPTRKIIIGLEYKVY